MQAGVKTAIFYTFFTSLEDCIKNGLSWRNLQNLFCMRSPLPLTRFQEALSHPLVADTSLCYPSLHSSQVPSSENIRRIGVRRGAAVMVFHVSKLFRRQLLFWKQFHNGGENISGRSW